MKKLVLGIVFLLLWIGTAVAGGYGGYMGTGIGNGLNAMTSNILGLYQFEAQLRKNRPSQSLGNSDLDIRKNSIRIQQENLRLESGIYYYQALENGLKKGGSP